MKTLSLLEPCGMPERLIIRLVIYTHGRRARPGPEISGNRRYPFQSKKV
jgi:hypothetical protein